MQEFPEDWFEGLDDEFYIATRYDAKRNKYGACAAPATSQSSRHQAASPQTLAHADLHEQHRRAPCCGHPAAVCTLAWGCFDLSIALDTLRASAGVKAGQDQAAWESSGWINQQDPRGEASLSAAEVAAEPLTL